MTTEKPAAAKPVSPSCERNREPILAVLRKHFADRHHVLEIGSGTGQHAVFFAQAMPWLTWQCSDVADNLPGIGQWLDEAGLPNTPGPIQLDVARGPWPAQRFDAVFSANSLHIMSWMEVEAFFYGVDRMLERVSVDARPSSALRAPSPRARGEGPVTPNLRARGADPLPAAEQGEGCAAAPMLVVYGPFNYDGAYTSDSNRAFDGWLRARDPCSGIRDFEAVDALARSIGLQLVDDVAMPAHNRCIVWRR